MRRRLAMCVFAAGLLSCFRHTAEEESELPRPESWTGGPMLEPPGDPGEPPEYPGEVEFGVDVSCLDVRIVRGGTAVLRVGITRAPDVDPVELTAVNLPEGVHASPIELPVGATTAEIVLRADVDADLSVHHPARVYAHSAGGDFRSADMPIHVTDVAGEVSDGRGGSFKRSGIVPTGFAEPQVLTLPDGGVAVLGSIDRCATVMKLDRDGALEESFGDGGVFVMDLPGHTRAWLTGVGDGGSLLVHGAHITYGHYPRSFLYRLTPGGEIDPAFGEAGRVLTYPYSVARADRRGRVVVAARHPIHGSDASPILILQRVLPDGSGDPSFGADGWVAWSDPLMALSSSVNVALDSRGRILVSLRQYGSEGTTLVRFYESGALDPNFPRVTGLPYLVGLTFDERDRILALGGSGYEANNIRRFTPQGNPDPTFGTGGLATCPSATTYRVVLPYGNTILVGGRAAGDAYVCQLDEMGSFVGEIRIDGAHASSTSSVSTGAGWIYVGASTAIDGMFEDGFVARVRR